MRSAWIVRVVGVMGCVAASWLGPALIVAAQSGISDVVRTTDGGMYRGTIIERVPGDHLILLLPSGETRRFEAAQVQSAGPVDEAPVVAQPVDDGMARSAPPLSGLPQPTEVRLRVTSPTPGTTLLYQSGMGAGSIGNTTAMILSFERLCTAPCEVTLERGNHTFVVEDANGRQRATPRPVMVDRDGEIEASIESRRPQRMRRWLIGLGLMGLSAPFIIAGVNDQQCDEDDLCHANWALLGPGIAMIAGGYGTMMSAIFAFDRGHVEFRPY